MSSSNRAVQKLVKLANRGEKYDVWAMRSQDYCDIGFVGTLWYAVSQPCPVCYGKNMMHGVVQKHGDFSEARSATLGEKVF